MSVYACLMVFRKEKVLLINNDHHLAFPYQKPLSLLSVNFGLISCGNLASVVQEAFENKLGCKIEFERPIPYFYEEVESNRIFFIFKANLCGNSIEDIGALSTVSEWKSPNELSPKNTHEYILSAIKYFIEI